jgi:uncharacterized SAM-binding protein YcdF (DUF218 family)
VHSLLWTLKDNWHLAAPLPLLVAIGIGVALLYGRQTTRWGRRWLLAWLLGYWAISTAVGSWVIAAPLVHGQTRLESAAGARGAQAIVVLGGGIFSRSAGDLAVDDLMASGLRVLEGVRLYRLLGNPLLIVSGGNAQRVLPPRPESSALRAVAIGLGVPADRVVEDRQSLTTREQALVLSRVLADRHIERFVLVTSPLHMRRSLAAFRAAGLDPIPSASELRDVPDDAFWTLVPDRNSLQVSDGATYEYLAFVYYWWRGWLAKPRS